MGRSVDPRHPPALLLEQMEDALVARHMQGADRDEGFAALQQRGHALDHGAVAVVEEGFLEPAGAGLLVVARQVFQAPVGGGHVRSEEHTSELQSLMRNSYAVFCLKKKKQ